MLKISPFRLKLLASEHSFAEYSILLGIADYDLKPTRGVSSTDLVFVRWCVAFLLGSGYFKYTLRRSALMFCSQQEIISIILFFRVLLIYISLSRVMLSDVIYPCSFSDSLIYYRIRLISLSFVPYTVLIDCLLFM
jgi:hypothetical protein